MNPHSLEPSLIVGIGASAGGLDALERFFRAMPPDTGMTFVVIQHLSPDFRSLMDELIARFTAMTVVRVTDTQEPKPNTIYLLSPSTELTFSGGLLHVVERSSDALPTPINRFLCSIAAERGDRCAGVILSGTGSDGTRGIKDIHEQGGLVLVQGIDSAKFDGMPKSAIATGLVHAALSPEEMTPVLIRYAGKPGRSERVAAAGAIDRAPSDQADVLWSRLREVAGIDFAAYKPATLRRRIERRMALGRFQSLEDYLRALDNDQAEVAALHSDLLICVTRFFRDPEAFDALGQALPDLFQTMPDGASLRVWVPACATGEEAYSIAFLIAAEAERLGRAIEPKVFATDVHSDSLRSASDGLYSEEAIQAVPGALREQFFLREVDGRFRVVARIRKNIVFSVHNLIRDAPFRNMDVVSCRNAIIYFNGTAQARALAALHHALRIGGVLFLGPSESVGALEAHLQALHRGVNLYRKTAEARAQTSMLARPEPSQVHRPHVAELRILRAYDRLLESFVPPSILVDERREILHVFGGADRFIRAPSGRPSLDVTTACLPELKGAVSLALTRSLREGEPITLREVSVTLEGRRALVDLTAQPLVGRPREEAFALLRIQEHDAAVVREEGHASVVTGGDEDRVTVLESELEETRASLNEIVQELEAANEELQASNEELIASNEELQSTNEELHAVNEELYSVNSEHEQKLRELALSTADLRNLMNASHLGIIFLDETTRIRLFTQGAVDVLNLLPHDIGRPVTDITARVPDRTLFDDLARVERTGDPAEAEIPSGERWLLRRIARYHNADNQRAGFVLTFLDITERKRVEVAERRSLELLKAVVDTLPAHIAVVDDNGMIRLVNKAWERFAHDNGHPGDFVGTSYFAPMETPPTEQIGRTRAMLRDVLAGARETCDFDYPCHSPEEKRWFWMNARRLPEGGAVISHTNISARVEAEAANASLATVVEASQDGIVGLDLDGLVRTWNRGATAMFGLEVGEICGRSITEIFPVELRAEHADRMRRVLEGESVRLETTCQRRDGRKLDVHLSLSPVAERREVTGMALVLSDVTARNQAIADRRQMEVRLAESARLESLGVLAGGIAHDFNNLLAAMLANLEFVRKAIAPESEVGAAIAESLSAVQVATQLSRQMLAYSGRTQIERRKLQIERLVDGTLPLVRTHMKSAAITRDPGPPVPPVEVDEPQIQQVVMNLLINALEAVEAARDGRVRIRVRHDSTSAEASPFGHVELSVDDNGCGIPPENQVKIFEPFFTTKFTGRGLGLAAAQGIVRAHGGTLGVESRPGCTMFTMRLPAASLTAPREAEPVSSVPPRSYRPRRILVVDDESLVRRALKRLLERDGHSCTLAEGAREAYDIARRADPPFEVALVDLSMPEISGREAASELKRGYPSMRVVLMSGYSASDIGTLDPGPDGFLGKPVEVSQLRACLEA